MIVTLSNMADGREYYRFRQLWENSLFLGYMDLNSDRINNSRYILSFLVECETE